MKGQVWPCLELYRDEKMTWCVVSAAFTPQNFHIKEINWIRLQTPERGQYSETFFFFFLSGSLESVNTVKGFMITLKIWSKDLLNAFRLWLRCLPLTASHVRVLGFDTAIISSVLLLQSASQKEIKQSSEAKCLFCLTKRQYGPSGNFFKLMM